MHSFLPLLRCLRQIVNQTHLNQNMPKEKQPKKGKKSERGGDHYQISKTPQLKIQTILR